ncbi:MAG: tyrosyl-tRNA synthetase [Actinomycetota bacterium]|nr:tyrosyl-tRNA synthetase [Actinomycetota bacterium]
MPAVGQADVFEELEWRGMVAQVTDPDLGDRLRAESLTFYVGFDATADSLHVGSLLPLMVTARLQRAGHRPIVLLGGGTTLVGDPSGKDAERPVLAEEQIRANAEGIRRQVERIVGTEVDLVDNADWLGQLRLTDFLRDVGGHFRVNDMMAKDSVRARLDRDQGISYKEFSYMLLQAYDFWHLCQTRGCRLQVGGSDQWGNITAGIDLIHRRSRIQAYGLTFPLVTRADGSKFGKSEGGNLWLDPARTSPYEFFQFWLRVADADVGYYLRLFTWLDRARIEELEAAVAEHPERREAQRVLAREVTTAVHGAAAAEAAEQAGQALFGGELGGLDGPTLLEVFAEAPATSRPRAELEGEGGLGLVELLVDTGLVASRSAARTAIDQGGVYVNNRREADVDRRLGPSDLLVDSYLVLRRGKRSYHLVRLV